MFFLCTVSTRLVPAEVLAGEKDLGRCLAASWLSRSDDEVSTRTEIYSFKQFGLTLVLTTAQSHGQNSSK
jgi:hypothetical protein